MSCLLLLLRQSIKIADKGRRRWRWHAHGASSGVDRGKDWPEKKKRRREVGTIGELYNPRSLTVPGHRLTDTVPGHRTISNRHEHGKKLNEIMPVWLLFFSFVLRPCLSTFSLKGNDSFSFHIEVLLGSLAGHFKNHSLLWIN